MNKLAFAAIIGAAALINGAASAQSSFDRDLAIARLTDSHDQSSGGVGKSGDSVFEASPNARFVARSQMPRESAVSANTQRDREIARLTDSRDQSTGFPK